tara:strand:- start:15914 stop:16903 length:990 start_codon:yes stop_codon:yes gene_type:complete
MAHLQLEGLEGSWEVDALLVNEAGASPVDPLDIEDQPLWGITRHDNKLVFCEDSLRAVLQQWSRKEVEDSLSVFWETPRRQTYRVQTTDDPLWACTIQTRFQGVVARFKCPIEAAHWLHLLPRSNSSQPNTYLDSYLSRPLTATQHQAQWWMPAEFVATPFVLESFLRHSVLFDPSLSGKALVDDVPPESWWGVCDSTVSPEPVAEFRLPAMAIAFQAAQLYRLTHTRRDLAPGVPVLLTKEGSSAVVVKTPRAHHLTRHSLITVALRNGEEQTVRTAELSWHDAEHSKKHKQPSKSKKSAILQVLHSYDTAKNAVQASAATTYNTVKA